MSCVMTKPILFYIFVDMRYDKPEVEQYKNILKHKY